MIFMSKILRTKKVMCVISSAKNKKPNKRIFLLSYR